MKLSPLKERTLKFRGIDILTIENEYTRDILSVYEVHCSSSIICYATKDSNTEESGFYFERTLQGKIIWSKILFRKKNEKTGNYVQAKAAFEMRVKMIFANQSRACDNYYNDIEKENEFIRAAENSPEECRSCRTIFDVYDYLFRQSLINKSKEKNYRGYALLSFEKKEVDAIIRARLCYHCSLVQIKRGHDKIRETLVKSGGKK